MIALLFFLHRDVLPAGIATCSIPPLLVLATFHIDLFDLAWILAGLIAVVAGFFFRKRFHGSWILGIGAVLYVLGGFVLHSTQVGEQARIAAYVFRFLVMTATLVAYLLTRSAHSRRLIESQRDELERQVIERTRELRTEKERSEKLLLNILPSEVAEELKAKGEAEAKLIEAVTILFTDFKGFTQASEMMTPQELVQELNTCFKAFDHIITAHGIEKIKTIGDAYMCAGGLPDPKTSSPVAVVRAALEMQAFMIARKAERDGQGKPAFEMRVGVHTGPVVAGIVGVKKFQYDIWGDTVNTASRMESSGEVGQVNISESTYELVKHEPGITFAARGKVQAKGKGEMEMYFVYPGS